MNRHCLLAVLVAVLCALPCDASTRPGMRHRPSETLPSTPSATPDADAPVEPATVRYDSTWASIDSRPIPSWYDEAKFGIFIHWSAIQREHSHITTIVQPRCTLLLAERPKVKLSALADPTARLLCLLLSVSQGRVQCALIRQSRQLRRMVLEHTHPRRRRPNRSIPQPHLRPRLPLSGLRSHVEGRAVQCNRVGRTVQTIGCTVCGAYVQAS